MKKAFAALLLCGLAFGLLMPSLVITIDNKMVMKGPGGGGPPSSDPADPITYYTDSTEDKWAVFIGISDYFAPELSSGLFPWIGYSQKPNHPRAHARSSMRSSEFSIPQDKRIMLSAIPTALRCSIVKS